VSVQCTACGGTHTHFPGCSSVPQDIRVGHEREDVQSWLDRTDTSYPCQLCGKPAIFKLCAGCILDRATVIRVGEP
jgi:hypothetical protein